MKKNWFDRSSFWREAVGRVDCLATGATNPEAMNSGLSFDPRGIYLNVSDVWPLFEAYHKKRAELADCQRALRKIVECSQADFGLDISNNREE